MNEQQFEKVGGKKPKSAMRFHTSKSGDKKISLKEYVDRMKEGQSVIYYIAGKCIADASTTPTLEDFRLKGLEVLYVADPADENAIQQCEEFDGKNDQVHHQGGP